MTTIVLKVEVPIACFRQSRSREYIETYPVPPPSTMYGMLLSLVGEENRSKHCGVKLAMALLSEPEKSVTLRTFHRFKKSNIDASENVKPDFQELLTDVKLAVWINAGIDRARPTLPERLEQAFVNPASVNRFGGLCLGESRDLVNVVKVLSEKDKIEFLKWLVKDEDGSLVLPYWVDHVGSKGTRCLRYLLQQSAHQQPPELAWTTIQKD
ncbi:MAG: type I-MYXAN CRISPR-associated protein Cas5/Cmx5/DevS [Calothrix sp. FI2-JRJ7]|nr:type I-MYXAN CRISPR-associated protein Cas5/Cmx5/DevS [Calothrix sp. FI2-JRJ7]